jgi:hypothetical protein
MGISTQKRLDLDASAWSLGEEAFKKIVETIQATCQPSRIIEFGSGVSSIRLALAFPNARIISIESDRLCFQHTASLAKDSLRQPNLDLRYRPLNFQSYGTGQILSYEKDNFFEGEKVDCAIIDGPPFYTLRGREACLYQIYEWLDQGGLVFLDDCQRAEERIILDNWLAVYPESFSMEFIVAGHQLAVLRKIRTVEPIWDAEVRLKDSLMINESYSRFRIALMHLDYDALLRFGIADRQLALRIRDSFSARA